MTKADLGLSKPEDEIKKSEAEPLIAPSTAKVSPAPEKP